MKGAWQYHRWRLSISERGQRHLTGIPSPVDPMRQQHEADWIAFFAILGEDSGGYWI